MVLGFSMLFPKAQPEDAPEVEQTDAAARRGAAPNIAFVPLAMPGTAGRAPSP